MEDLVQRGCNFERIARALRTTAVYLRCADVRFFFRAVIEAHSRAREYAAATPRRSTLQSRDPDPDPNRGQIGNVFLDPKKHRRPHLDNNAERSPTVLGATRDHLGDDIIYIYYVYINKYIYIYCFIVK
jgi:hypothetical protein